MSESGGLPSTNGVTTLLPPPEGYVVNFDNPQQQYFTEMCVTIFLATGLQVDDGFLAASYLAGIVPQVITMYSFVTGSQGVHMWEMSIEKAEGYLHCRKSVSYAFSGSDLFCGSVPTLRRFAAHVAPRLLGNSQTGSQSDPNVPRSRSYTPKRRNRYYARFGSGRGDDDVEFNILSRMGVKRGKSGEGTTTVVTGTTTVEAVHDPWDASPRGEGTTTVITGTTTVEAVHDSWDASPCGEDNDSEQGIMTTRTVTIR
ncbi:hypothetical protein DL769_004440 [Monosporascus sp. CRB-8-3]|nr:hypothetical protein DL769_004440 [Monosporascus sp. CRB-8-3]